MFHGVIQKITLAQFVLRHGVDTVYVVHLTSTVKFFWYRYYCYVFIVLHQWTTLKLWWLLEGSVGRLSYHCIIYEPVRSMSVGLAFIVAFVCSFTQCLSSVSLFVFNLVFFCIFEYFCMVVDSCQYHCNSVRWKTRLRCLVSFTIVMPFQYFWVV